MIEVGQSGTPVFDHVIHGTPNDDIQHAVQRSQNLQRNSTSKTHVGLVLAVCMPYICTRYEPQYEAVSLRSGTDHLYNPSKPIPTPHRSKLIPSPRSK
jgi:hypothetical protein